MKWIKVVTRIADDQDIGRLADALKVKTAHAIGLCVCVFIRLPEQAKTGDVSQVPTSTLEEWARWTGKRGAFATAFRAILCTAEGVVRDWESINGAAIREYERTAKRPGQSSRGSSENPRGKTPNNPPRIREEKEIEQERVGEPFKGSPYSPSREGKKSPAYAPPRRSAFCAYCEPLKTGEGFWDHAPNCPLPPLAVAHA